MRSLTDTFPTRRPPRRRLLIFARVPERGRVKTRLARELGDDRTLELYEAMLADLLEAIGPADDEVEVEVLWTGSEAVGEETLHRYFSGLPLAMQTGETLGDRLSVAMAERFFFHETEEVIVIGADDPGLSRQTVRTAFRLLDSCEWVVGPAADGGYYLIGCRAESFDAAVFRDIDWGTSAVLAATIERIRRQGFTMAMLPRRSDLDLADDLRAFSAAARPDSRIAGLLRGWGWMS